MAEAPLTWLGGTTLAWGDGRSQALDSWGQPMPSPPAVVDPPTPLTDLAIPLRNQPMRVWKAQPSLRKVVGFIARNVAVVPLHVYKRVSDTDRARDRDGTAETLLRTPAPFTTGVSLVHDLVVDFLLYDRWLAVVIDGPDGVQQLRRVPAGLVDVDTDFLGGIKALRVRTSKGLVDVTGAVVAYDAGWSGSGGGGVSPLLTLESLLDEQSDAVTYRREVWRNAAKFRGILQKSEGVLPKQNRERLVASWREFTASKQGGTPILDDGVTYVPLNGPTPKDVRDLDGRQLTDAEVASAYHVPPELVGARPGTFANVQAFRQMLYGPVLGPLLSRIEAAINARIVPHLAGDAVYAEFAREAAMAGSFLEQADVFSRTAGGPWMTRNEVRARVNLPWIEGGDDLITPMNVTEGGLASPADTAPDGDPYGEDQA